MTSLLILLLGTVLIQNSSIVLGKNVEQITARATVNTEISLALLTLINLTLSSMWGYLINIILVTHKIEALRTPVLLLGLVFIFSIERLVFRKRSHAIRWPNFNTHLSNQCAMLGIALFSSDFLDSLYEAFIYGLGTSALLAILNACFLALRQRVDMADVPLPFKGIPIALISVGFMALGLLGFSGMVRH